MTAEISTTQDGAILRLSFNRADKKNAITADMYAALADGLARAAEDESVRVVLFEAAGDVFTAGNDIGDFMARGVEPMNSDHPAPVMRFLQAIATIEKPLVAAVQGPAVGVGVTMLLHCDLVYASAAATFHTPFVDLALVPEAASSLLMPQIAGHQRAAEMLMLGEKIGANRALEFGFVNDVVAADALSRTALGAAEALAEKAPDALRMTKKLMKGDLQPVLARMAQEGEHFEARLKSPEFREAGAAFLQKRKPDFSNLG
ncbi:MAG: enoyl-CoA hydratase [Pseudomonadota bacterium]